MEFREAELLKLETRADAPVPQEDKFPSGTVLATGEVHREPKVGSTVIMARKERFGGGFTTSEIVEIEEETPNYVQFKTRNSRYKLIWTV